MIDSFWGHPWRAGLVVSAIAVVMLAISRAVSAQVGFIHAGIAGGLMFSSGFMLIGWLAH